MRRDRTSRWVGTEGLGVSAGVATPLVQLSPLCLLSVHLNVPVHRVRCDAQGQTEALGDIYELCALAAAPLPTALAFSVCMCRNQSAIPLPAAACAKEVGSVATRRRTLPAAKKTSHPLAHTLWQRGAVYFTGCCPIRDAGGIASKST